MADQEERSRAPVVPLRRVLALAKPELPVLAVATAALLISSGMSLAYPQAIRYLVDAVLERGDLGNLNLAAGVLVVLFFIQAVFSAVRAWLFTQAGEKVVARLREDVFRAILGQDVSFFDQSRTGELISRLSSDTSVLQNTVTVNISMALRYIVGSIGGLALLLYTSPKLTGVAMAVVPFVAFGAALLGRYIRTLSSQVQDALADANEVADETIAGARTVRSFAGEEAEVKRYGVAVDRSYRLAARRAMVVGGFYGTAGFAGYAAIALVVWWGGRMVLAETMTVGDLTAFLLYTLMVAMSLGALTGLYSDFMRATGASRRVFELLDAVAPIEGSHGDDPGEVHGDVRFAGVHFAYPTRPDVPVLSGLDLDLPRGHVAALVGPSGAGKSTVAGLLARFYDPQEGEVSVDGRDIRELDPRALRRRIAMVAQEPVLFATSIAENIRYGRPDATDADVESAARAANAYEFVSAFPDGFATTVGERGVRLSGGQKQRIAIARALLKDPPILVLDEATSALDAESEHLVQEALERLMEGRTTLIIAHRLSTVRRADEVVVLDGGKVVERGSHDELVAANGLYRKLVERQLKWDDEAA
jgi:ABC transporter fused permease/ATP-binding protein